MNVAKEILLKNATIYEESKLKDSFAAIPHLKRALAIGSKMVEKEVMQSNKKKSKNVKRWMKYMSMEHVSRRLYQGVPDYVSFRTDYFCSLMMCGDREIFEAIGLLGYLVRYGFWSSDATLILDEQTKNIFISDIGIEISRFEMLMRKIYDHQLLIHVVEVEGKDILKLNSDIVILMNEHDKVFVKDGHKQKKVA